MRAERLAIRLRPAYVRKRRLCFRLGQPHDLRQCEGLGRRGKEKMLRHRSTYDYFRSYMTFTQWIVNGRNVRYALLWSRMTAMELAKSEKEIAERAARFLKAELKRANVTYEELAQRLNKHGLKETRDSVAAKLKRGTFAATFFLGCLAALEMEGMRLEDL